MRRFLSRIVVSLGVVSLVTPATIASAAEPAGVTGAETVSVPPTVATNPPALAGSLREATERAVTAQAARTVGQDAPQPAPRGRGARYQIGGGGKSAMIMGLVYTAVGIGASVYMYKMVQERNNEDASKP
jgi:hypothetical protein